MTEDATQMHLTVDGLDAAGNVVDPAEWLKTHVGAPEWLREMIKLFGQPLPKGTPGPPTQPAPDIDAAKKLLAQHGFVVLKAKSYRAAQQRQHIAEAIANYADQRRESVERWAQTTLHNERIELQARCTFLYGAARAHGATVEELRGRA